MKLLLPCAVNLFSCMVNLILPRRVCWCCGDLSAAMNLLFIVRVNLTCRSEFAFAVQNLLCRGEFLFAAMNV